MEFKEKVFRRKSGKSKGKWIARIEYFDDVSGKMKCIERQADKRADAVDLKNARLNELKASGGQMPVGERMTFNQLADICERSFYHSAVIHEGKKISGVRSDAAAKGQIKNLREYFGKRLIKNITSTSLTEYKVWRLTTKVEKLDRTVKLATVNRALAIMRRMMKHAFRRRWVMDDIFLDSNAIDMTGEAARTRLLTLDEEKRLLATCIEDYEVDYERKRKGVEEKVKMTIKNRNYHLRTIIILALDSGMRRAEILKLEWKDIDFDNNCILVVGTNTKTELERLAPLSTRAKRELLRLKESYPNQRPFPLTDIKKPFENVKSLAKIDDLHFHDLRRTAVTRWIQQGTPLTLAGKLAGHTKVETTNKHYVSTDVQIVKEAAQRMDDFNEQMATKEDKTESGFLN